MEIISWVLLFAVAVVAFLLFNTSQKQAAQIVELTEKLKEAESARKQPLAAAAGGPVAVPRNSAKADAAVAEKEKQIAAKEKQLGESRDEVKRLTKAIDEAKRNLQTEKEKSAAATARATSAEATAASARSRAVEATHSAAAESRKENEDLKAALDKAESEQAQVVAAARRAETEANLSLQRSQQLEAEVSGLKAKLNEAEATVSAVREGTRAIEIAKQDAIAVTEARLRESFELHLRNARTDWEGELQSRLTEERERFDAEQKRLARELEQARVEATTIESSAATTPEPVILPMRSTRARFADSSAADVEPSEPEEKPLVLLADSDANAVRTLTKHLETNGYNVHSVATVSAAIQAARALSPAAIAIDGANLPDGDCWKVLTAVKEDSDLREIPVLVFAPGRDKERALEMGAVGCFAKPVDKNVLVSTIKAALVRRKQRARLAAVSGAGGSTARRRSSLLTAPSEV